MTGAYLEQMKEDILSYIEENEIEVTEDNRDEVAEKLNDDLWCEDSVTGNASGSYFCNSYESKAMVCTSEGEDYVRELISEFGLEPKTIAEHMFDWEYWDVSIRCYLLYQAIDAALDELV